MHTFHVPILAEAETIILGGTVAGLACALQQADAGRDVLLIEQGTCLYREMDQSASYILPDQESNVWYDRLFPKACRVNQSLAHPDRLKLQGEALCEAAGIRILYAMQALQYHDGILLVAHKSGLYGIRSAQVYDCRTKPIINADNNIRCFALHIMQAPATLPPSFTAETPIVHGSFSIPAGTPISVQPGPAGVDHAVCMVPIHTQADVTTAQGRFSLYALALSAFSFLKSQPGCKDILLARSGYTCVPEEGLPLLSMIEEGLATPEGWQAGGKPTACPALRHDNPLFPTRTKLDLPCMPIDTWQGDILVIGGGTAGAVAAYSAARQGMRVRLVEMNEMLGGTGTCGGVSIYWFGTRDGATAEIDARVSALYAQLGLPRGRCLWSDDDVFLPDLKAHALLALCLEAGVDIVFGSITCAAMMEGDAISGVAYVQDGKLCTARAQTVIDTTGDADVAMFAGAQHTYGGQQNMLTYWGSLAQYTSPASYRNNFSTMVHVGSPFDYTRFILAGRRRGEETYDHGRYVALRESRHIVGMETVTLAHLLSGNQPVDTLYQCFSNYDPKGKLTADVVYAGLLPPNLRMNVPRGAVIPVGNAGAPIRGLLVGGKAISCTHDALPGLRMQPDLQQQGYALGILAAESVKQKVPAWQATGITGVVAAGHGQRIEPATACSLSLQAAVDALTGTEPLEWLDMDVSQAISVCQPVIQCFLAESIDAISVLQEAFAHDANAPEKQLLLARLLLWHGCEDGISTILSAIRTLLNETPGLPMRRASTTFGQLLPDHGLMPEAVYFLNALAWGKTVDITAIFEEVLARLLAGPRDWRDLRAGIYCYVECFAYVAMRRGDTAFLPMLHALQALPELAGSGEDDQLLAERFAMLRLSLAEACTRLGDLAGYAALSALAKHPALAIAGSAEMLLTALPGAPAIVRIENKMY